LKLDGNILSIRNANDDVKEHVNVDSKKPKQNLSTKYTCTPTHIYTSRNMMIYARKNTKIYNRKQLI